ncbi:MAG TPA: molybdenum cofactor guanylyltransferase [Candidatus Acidoferrales bacterium]|nr:molybdenum cofactor guanylyltransferase [Candidatus Acidoferrales bacterium]
MALSNVTGFVLAGGKSMRMGRDKAVLQLEGRTLLEHALDTLRQVCAEVMVLGSREFYADFGAEVVQDIFPGCGPLAGIHAGLSRTRTDFNLIIAVDTPFLSADFLRFMAQRAIESGAVVTTPQIAGYKQPLCSVYSREFLPIAEGALQPQKAQKRVDAPQTSTTDQCESARIGNQPVGSGGKSREYKIVPLFPADRTCIITEEEMRRFAFAPEMFENLNTPDDLERARRRTAAEPAS